MNISKDGIKFIERWEGCILQSYDDANDHVVGPGDPIKGTLTIGTGHTSAAGLPKVVPGMVITQEEADQILANDLKRVEADVNALVKVPLNQNQFDALVSFQFNTGALGRSSSLKYLNEGNYQEAADRLRLWNKSKKISPNPLPGLVARREDERKLFLTPITEEVEKPTMPSLPLPLKAVFWFITPEKIGSWVRAATASLLTAGAGILAAKIPFLSQFLTPDLITMISASVGTVVGGALGHISKGEKVDNLIKAQVPEEVSDKVLDHTRKD